MSDDDERPTRPLEQLKIVEILVTIREGVEELRNEIDAIKDAPQRRQELIAEVQRLRDAFEGFQGDLRSLERAVKEDESTTQSLVQFFKTKAGLITLIILFVLVVVAAFVLGVDVDALLRGMSIQFVPSTISLVRIYEHYNGDQDESDENDSHWPSIFTAGDLDS